MNQFASLLAKQTIQSCAIRSNQLGVFNRIAWYSTETSNKLPLSKNPKHKTSPRITLVSPEDKIEITTLDQARKIAERRQLKLVSILDYDTKTSRPLYKLMTGAEYHAEELKKRDERKLAKKEQHIKSEKLLTLGNKISEHDLNSKLAKCVKWLEKLHEIRVVISGDPSETEKAEKMFTTIETGVAIAAGRIVQKRVKDGSIKFSILPTIKKSTETPQKPAAEKKLLEVENPTVLVQQARSHHTRALIQLAQPNHHHHPQLFNNGGLSTKCSKCADEKVTSKRIKMTAVVGILLLAKYGFWSFVYSSLKR